MNAVHRPVFSEQERDPKEKITFTVTVKKKWKNLKKGAISTSLFLVTLLIFFHFFLAKTEIKIWPKTEIINLDEKVTADAKANQISSREKVIPGEIFEEQRSASQQFPTSGKALKETNAQGIIRVYNNYDLPQPLVANTRFQPPLEKVLYFRAVKSVVIPAKSYLDVEVKADRPGEDYNIAPSTFSIPGLAGLPQYYSVYGKSASAMTGGFKGEAPKLTEKDLQDAEKILMEKIENEIKSYLNSKTSDDFVILDGGIFQETVEASSSVQVGEQVESFNFNLKVKSKTISFKKSDLESLVKEIVNSKLQDANKKIQPEHLKIDYSLESADKNSGKIVLNLKISAKIYSDIDLISLKRNLFGKPIEETRVLLENQPQIDKVQIKVFPFWLKKNPGKDEKIQIKLNLDPVRSSEKD